MKRTILQGGLVAVALAAVAVSCSNKPETQLTPSGVTETATFANPDGSTVKANAPTGLSPNGGTLDTRRPTLSFTNASGRLPGVRRVPPAYLWPNGKLEDRTQGRS